MVANRERLKDALYPPGAVCAACGALRVDDLPTRLCARCARGFRPLPLPCCARCGKPGWQGHCPDCLTLPPDAIDARRAAFAYVGAAGRLVRALKYDHVLAAADTFAPAMAAAMPGGRFDAIVPVPLHRRRERMRGFNQALALASALAARCGLPVLEALERTRHTKAQARLTGDKRAENVRDAFRAVMPMDGLSLLLVDDVLTTGSTALACAEALRRAGAVGVSLLTATRAGVGEEA